MKVLIIVIVSLFSSFLFANNHEANGYAAGLYLESETISQKSGDGNIQGYDTYFLAEPYIVLEEKHLFAVGAQVNNRVFSDHKNIEQNRDGLQETYLKYQYDFFNFKDDGVDLAFRVVSFFSGSNEIKEASGHDGGQLIRAYFGGEVIGDLTINRSLSYISYSKYSLNEYSNFSTTEHASKIQVTPHYAFDKDLCVYLSLVYSESIDTGNVISKGASTSLGSRLQLDSTFGVNIRGDMDAYESNNNGDLVSVENPLNGIAYSLAFDASF